MNAGDLRHTIEVWANVKGESELQETEVTPQKVGELRYVEIKPQTGSMQRQPGIETRLSNVTHKAIVRYHAGKHLTDDQWFMFRGQRFDIRFILNPFFRNESLEIFLEEIRE